MSLLDAATLTSLRALSQSAMTTTVQFETRPQVVDNEGGTTSGAAVLGAAIPADIQPMGMSPQERAAGERVSDISRWIIRVPWNTTVPSETGAQAVRLVEAASGRRFELVSALPASLMTELALICTEIT